MNPHRIALAAALALAATPLTVTTPAAAESPCTHRNPQQGAMVWLHGANETISGTRAWLTVTHHLRHCPNGYVGSRGVTYSLQQAGRHNLKCKFYETTAVTLNSSPYGGVNPPARGLGCHPYRKVSRSVWWAEKKLTGTDHHTTLYGNIHRHRYPDGAIRTYALKVW